MDVVQVGAMCRHQVQEVGIAAAGDDVVGQHLGCIHHATPGL
jgi:hypothetical protein